MTNNSTPKNSHDFANLCNEIRQTPFVVLPRPPEGVWWLFGTEGCHLCDEAHQLIQIVGNCYPVPSVIRQDIMALPDDLMQVLSLHIPVLVSQKSELYWRFGLNDVVALL